MIFDEDRQSQMGDFRYYPSMDRLHRAGGSQKSQEPIGFVKE
jgi:hypothetical protein